MSLVPSKHIKNLLFPALVLFQIFSSMLLVKYLLDYFYYFVGVTQFLSSSHFPQLNFLYITYLLYLAKPQGAFEEEQGSPCVSTTPPTPQNLSLPPQGAAAHSHACLSSGLALPLFSSNLTTLC